MSYLKNTIKSWKKALASNDQETRNSAARSMVLHIALDEVTSDLALPGDRTIETPQEDAELRRMLKDAVVTGVVTAEQAVEWVKQQKDVPDAPAAAEIPKASPRKTVKRGRAPS